MSVFQIPSPAFRLAWPLCSAPTAGWAAQKVGLLSSISTSFQQRCGGSSAPGGHMDVVEGPLSGVKVLDLGQVIAGNFCGATLGYFGADVIKVEPPGRGDDIRSLRTLDEHGTSMWWRAHGRNKRCITVDLHNEEGREIVRKLASKSDVLVENFRPGVMEKWGLGPSDLPASLVYARISGYGQTGPKASMPGYASVCEGVGGLRYVNGYPDRPPVRPNISLGDTLAGLHAAFGVVMALLHRQKPGTENQGQVVDSAITESVFNMLEGCVTEYAMAGVVREPSGSTISGVVPSGTFKTVDGHFVVIGGNGNSIYSRLMGAVGRPDMDASNPLYANNSERVTRENEIMSTIGDWVAARSQEEVLTAMKEARVPSGPIFSVKDIFDDPQYIARGMFHRAEVTKDGSEVVLPAILPVLSKTPGSTKWAGPSLGEHTEEVLKGELGMSDSELARLREVGAI